MRRCSECETEKPLEEFGKDSTRPEGRAYGIAFLGDNLEGVLKAVAYLKG
jgi:hypothetical protein